MLFGIVFLMKSEGFEGSEVLKLMNEVLELCERGFWVVKKMEEMLCLKFLRDKMLRFIVVLYF